MLRCGRTITESKLLTSAKTAAEGLCAVKSWLEGSGCFLNQRGKVKNGFSQMRLCTKRTTLKDNGLLINSLHLCRTLLCSTKQSCDPKKRLTHVSATVRLVSCWLWPLRFSPQLIPIEQWQNELMTMCQCMFTSYEGKSMLIAVKWPHSSH